MHSRRDMLLGSMLGTLATGLPAWFLMNPRRATAQDLACAVTAQENLQYLICCVNMNGDPISNNCPGTYGDVSEDAAQAVHPTDASMAETALTWGTRRTRRRRRGATVRLRAVPHGLHPPRDAGQQPRRSTQGAALDGRHQEQRDAARLRQGAWTVLRHRTDRASCSGAGGNASELELPGSNVAVRLSDAAPAAAHGFLRSRIPRLWQRAESARGSA